MSEMAKQLSASMVSAAGAPAQPASSPTGAPQSAASFFASGPGGVPFVRSAAPENMNAPLTVLPAWDPPPIGNDPESFARAVAQALLTIDRTTAETMAESSHKVLAVFEPSHVQSAESLLRDALAMAETFNGNERKAKRRKAKSDRDKPTTRLVGRTAPEAEPVKGKGKRARNA